ncbi:MAG: MFS transporter [Steroidobacteraceae bacterium]|jgi:MFS family permease
MTRMIDVLTPRTAPRGLSVKLVMLLATAVFINYVDRGNLATAAPLLQGDLHLTNTQLGLLLSAFFWAYAPMQLIAGYLAERLDVHRVLAIGVATWSIATMASGLAGSFLVLLLLRLALGIGESVVYPCSAKLLAMRALEHQRGKANGVILAGQALGPSIGTLVGGLLMARYGWRAVMISFGAISILWLLPWFLATHREPSTRTEAGTASPPSYLTILGQRAAWGACIGQFCCNYSFYFVLSWLPVFLVKSRGFSIVEMSKIAGVVYVINACFALVAGFGSDRWIQAGQSPTVARKTFIVGSCLGITACMLAAAGAPPHLAVVCLILTGLCFGLQSPMVHVIGQTLAGPRAAGQWMGLQNLSGNTAGILAPVITGYIVDRTGSFYWAFAVSGIISFMSAVSWGLIIPKIETIPWPDPQSTGRTAA